MQVSQTRSPREFGRGETQRQDQTTNTIKGQRRRSRERTDLMHYRNEERSMSEKPSTTLAGTVEKIIMPPSPNVPEKAQIAVEGADHLYRELRISNTLTDENGDKVRLKKG